LRLRDRAALSLWWLHTIDLRKSFHWNDGRAGLGHRYFLYFCLATVSLASFINIGDGGCPRPPEVLGQAHFSSVSRSEVFVRNGVEDKKVHFAFNKNSLIKFGCVNELISFSIQNGGVNPVWISLFRSSRDIWQKLLSYP